MKFLEVRPIVVRLMSIAASLGGLMLLTAPAHAACMEGRVASIASVNPEGRGEAIQIAVSEQDVAEFVQRGFRPVACYGALASPEGRAAYRDQVCEMAATGNEAVQAQLAQALGTKPVRLCAAAKALMGSGQAPAP